MNDSSRPFSVAVVDDDAELRRVLRRALETAGYEVMEGGDGLEILGVNRSFGRRVEAAVGERHRSPLEHRAKRLLGAGVVQGRP